LIVQYRKRKQEFNGDAADEKDQGAEAEKRQRENPNGKLRRGRVALGTQDH